MKKNNEIKVFPLWLILSFLIAPMLAIRNGIILGDMDFGKIVFMSLVTAIPFVIGGLIVWGILILIYKAVAPRQKISAKVALIVWAVIVVLLFSVTFITQKNNASQPSVSKEYQTSIVKAINEIRAQQGLPALILDDKLCAFAKKQAIDLNKEGNNSKNSLNDPANAPYFVGFNNVVMDSIEGGLLNGDKEMATVFMGKKGEGATRLEITHGCVADSAGSGGKFYTVFVGAVKE